MPELLIKELPTIIGIAAILGLIWFIGHGIHENGRKVERAIWMERDNERITAQAKELSEAMARVAAQSKQDINHTMGVINEKDKAIAKLKSDMRAQRASSGGMWITAQACDDSEAVRVRGKTDGSGESGGREQIRLPADVERSLEEIAELAQETVIAYNACVTELKNHVTVVP
ncbi:MAG: hypothetical protein HRU77_01520 [Gammaproteobacteria bacterium]|nr:MAG: hypothetical protein HRU77_01520 [Gammaproteobacteria bacterium]